jgi:ferritin
MRIPVISPRLRKRRIDSLVEEVAHHERQIRNALASLVELTVEGDDLHVECRRLLESLDG